LSICPVSATKLSHNSTVFPPARQELSLKFVLFDSKELLEITGFLDCGHRQVF
jgi:hypothetical protein